MKVIIDRFEGEFAVCEKENREMMDIEKDRIPIGAKEGTVLIIEGSKISMDTKETERRKKEIEKATEDLWN